MSSHRTATASPVLIRATSMEVLKEDVFSLLNAKTPRNKPVLDLPKTWHETTQKPKE